MDFGCTFHPLGALARGLQTTSRPNSIIDAETDKSDSFSRELIRSTLIRGQMKVTLTGGVMFRAIGIAVMALSLKIALLM
jgi:hypothetical protein